MYSEWWRSFNHTEWKPYEWGWRFFVISWIGEILYSIYFLKIVFVHNPSKVPLIDQKLFPQKILLQKNFSLNCSKGTSKKKLQTYLVLVCLFPTATEKVFSSFFCFPNLSWHVNIETLGNLTVKTFSWKTIVGCLLVVLSNLCSVAMFAVGFFYDLHKYLYYSSGISILVVLITSQMAFVWSLKTVRPSASQFETFFSGSWSKTKSFQASKLPTCVIFLWLGYVTYKECVNGIDAQLVFRIIIY